MWTIENRNRYDRDRLRSPSDLTDEEWELVEPVDPLRGTTPPAKRVEASAPSDSFPSCACCSPAAPMQGWCSLTISPMSCPIRDRDRARRRNNAKSFVVEPQRWIVERTIGWPIDVAASPDQAEQRARSSLKRRLVTARKPDDYGMLQGCKRGAYAATAVHSDGFARGHHFC
jgi:hypothetical protein